MLFNRAVRLVTGIMLILLCSKFCRGQQLPLAQAFAHNDYQHKRPLFEAISNGYTNIEVDIYIHKDRLVVTHVLPILHHKRTLEDLYLQPLAAHIWENNGEVYPGYEKPVTLMIDIKSDGNKTYRLLKPLLEKYREVLCGYQNGILQEGPVRIVLSGNKPFEALKNDTDRLAFIDKDLRKLGRDTADHNLFAMASCKFSKLLKWKGKGQLSQQDRAKLTAYCDEAHKAGAKVRLWSSPDDQNVWKQLLQCGVDLINTDKLSRLRDFLVRDGKTLIRED